MDSFQEIVELTKVSKTKGLNPDASETLIANIKKDIAPEIDRKILEAMEKDMQIMIEKDMKKLIDITAQKLIKQSTEDLANNLNLVDNRVKGII